jgi:hypothetical protein
MPRTRSIQAENTGVDTFNGNNAADDKLHPCYSETCTTSANKIFWRRKSDILSGLSQEAVEALIEQVAIEAGKASKRGWCEEKAELLKNKNKIIYNTNKNHGMLYLEMPVLVMELSR